MQCICQPDPAFGCYATYFSRRGIASRGRRHTACLMDASNLQFELFPVNMEHESAVHGNGKDTNRHAVTAARRSRRGRLHASGRARCSSSRRLAPPRLPWLRRLHLHVHVFKSCKAG